MQLQLAHIHQRVHALARVLKVATLRVVCPLCRCGTGGGGGGGESFRASHWVAVLGAMRARRANRRRHLGWSNCPPRYNHSLEALVVAGRRPKP
jgi:xanthine dehydrogenase molybdopterin-binding subunit B